MALGAAAIKLNLELWNNGTLKEVKSVIEMGDQKLYVKLADFEELVKLAQVSTYKKEHFSSLEQGATCPSKAFYEMLGIKYASMNKDLNFPLEDKSLYGQYDLVTDYGHNQHVFNTSEACRTMHKLAKTGGYLVFSQTVYPSQGFYAYDTSFFEGMAAANGYKILFSSFILTTKDSNQFHVPLSWELIYSFDWTKVGEIRVLYVMQKQSDADFRDPYQGAFLSMNQKHHGYDLKYGQNPPSRFYSPIHHLKDMDDKAFFKEFFKRLDRKIKLYLRIN